ncbi:flagellin FliC [Laribacter hongkongensis]|uniref:flagellin N-terminal helical domain-containing protein n=1 Tax=Laribacter hongkongensis TaxID=168471 RepID=UPI001EFED9BA|nr:flagellin [Laribacter hongkongensis]MCG9059710.1 flagellin FliC [Laribacter hongkongensis]MCG9086679.1 flagellin FliC [Laribacter hongkongensis]
MALYVNTNVSSLNAQRNLNSSTSSLSTSLQRLSSGLRVNSAKDDAAGMAIASGMTAQVRGANQAIRNANDGISMMQTAEGVLGQIETNVQRMRELAVQGANGSVNATNLTQVKKELDELGKENARLLKSQFNGQDLFRSSSFAFQIGAGTVSSANVISINIGTLAGSSGMSAAIASNASFSSAAAARTLMGSLDSALESIATKRAEMGAGQNRFEAVVSSLQTYVENMSASKGRIVDADFAAETANLTRNQIIQQAGTAMLAQANQLPQAALTLLR